jgi:hypothetical protein
LASEIDRLRTAVSDCQRQHAPMALAALRECLDEAIVPYSGARSALVAEFDEVFALAIAHDLVAQDLKTGEFTDSQTWADLAIPTPAGMDPLPYSQSEHGQRLQGAAVELLRGYGLHE